MTGPDWRVYRPVPRRVVPTGPTGSNGEPDLGQFAAFGRWVLSLHQPKPVAAAQLPECSCGSALVLCPYRTAATRYLGPPHEER